MSQPAATSVVKCDGCEREIEVCEGCQEPPCPAAICHECMNRSLGQTAPLLHDHGG